MPTFLDPYNQFFKIDVKTEDGALPRMQDIVGFLRDLNMVYEVCRVTTDPNYDVFRTQELVHHFGQFTSTVLRDEDRLHVLELKKSSPLELVAVLAALPTALGAVWCFVQIVEKVSNIRLNREKLELEVEKLRRENNATLGPLSVPDERELEAILYKNPKFFWDRIKNSHLDEVSKQAVDRLAESRVRITSLEIQVDYLDAKKLP